MRGKKCRKCPYLFSKAPVQTAAVRRSMKPSLVRAVSRNFLPIKKQPSLTESLDCRQKAILPPKGGENSPFRK